MTMPPDDILSRAAKQHPLAPPPSPAGPAAEREMGGGDITSIINRHDQHDANAREQQLERELQEQRRQIAAYQSAQSSELRRQAEAARAWRFHLQRRTAEHFTAFVAGLALVGALVYLKEAA